MIADDAKPTSQAAVKQWWRRPLRRRDKVAAVVIGAFVGFWFGLLGRLMLGPMPVSVTTLLWWAAGGIVTGVILGVRFPRAVTILLGPFAMLG